MSASALFNPCRFVEVSGKRMHSASTHMPEHIKVIKLRPEEKKGQTLVHTKETFAYPHYLE